MALGNKNQENTGELYVLKVKTTDENKKPLASPVFEVLEKNENNKWEITDTTPSVSGVISRVDVKEGEWEGNKFHTVSVLFKDHVENESYLCDFKMNMMNRSIFNSLLNADLSKDVKIGLYTSKKGYPSASVRQGEELINWKYSLDEVPAPEEVKFKGKIQRDYTETDNFFVEKLRELSARVAGNSAPPTNSAAPTKPIKVKKAKSPVDEVIDEIESSAKDDEDDVF